MKIGFFDSGLGGFMIMKAVIDKMPEYDYEFYGDTENLPYGDKNEAEIYELTKKGVESLFVKGCLLVIVACNTASAETLRKLQQEFLPEKFPDRKILGVIIPTIETLVENKSLKSLLIGTNRTINSKKYQKELEKTQGGLEIEGVATPDLVLKIENREYQEAVESICDLIEKRGEKDKVLILGCTHYSVIKDDLRKKLPNDITILSQDEIIPKKLELYLKNHPEIEEKLSKEKTRNVFLTKNSELYDELLEKWLNGTLIRG